MDNLVPLTKPVMEDVADDLTRFVEQVKAASYPDEIFGIIGNFELDTMPLDDLAVYVRSLETLEKSTRELMRGRSRNGEDVRAALESLQQMRTDFLEKRRKDS